ncbi:aldo/keto reductase family oxidoreductase [Neisseria leonii]|uniref:aldo/keto reductase n=1 Tax=Neisseria leonii TaxID=2995413 RepID=UPI00237B7079|nr:aldo/keto reductase [Neisseria sp. 3986]MDD9325243.1 aldo/keto reductase [Neisseria sp. 3986]
MNAATTPPDLGRLSHGHWRTARWGLSDHAYTRLIEAVIETGITTFDHADCYGRYTTEAAFGRAFRPLADMRDRLKIVSKCGILFPNDTLPGITHKHYDNTREHIIASAERSVTNLNCGYLDLLLIHRPSPCADPEAIAAAFDYLHQNGTVRHFGVSNYSAAKFSMLQSYVRQPLVTNQIELSLWHTPSFSDGLLDFLLEKRVKPMAWSPLGGGKLFDTADETGARIRQTLYEVGEAYGETRPDTLAYAWLLNHPAGIMPVVGSGKIEHIRNAVDALNIRFSEAEWIKLYSAAIGHDVP